MHCILSPSVHRYKVHPRNNQERHSVFFQKYLVVEETVASKTIARASFNKIFSSSSRSSSISTSTAEDYSVVIGNKIGNFLTHFWKSTGFWSVL